MNLVQLLVRLWFNDWILLVDVSFYDQLIFYQLILYFVYVDLDLTYVRSRVWGGGVFWFGLTNKNFTSPFCRLSCVLCCFLYRVLRNYTILTWYQSQKAPILLLSCCSRV
ncbi:hypothetical protein HanHA300_Chr04g0120711 [Helianthus annuus]|nr:hypothetical protein HanHA300_Chr04g0120711 [Helianthus annuus]KAJ0756240.1 hypothetical protein HanLR1_Chr04g0124771 [Helianthus annuus]KAJ0760020.1 hypothetical protein HanOQP8_Chr04g0133101 [Helianthus annuus]